VSAPPPPERIASWEQQALALLSERTPERKVLAHLRDVGCPEAIARRLVARNRDPARTRLRIKAAAIVGSGVSLIAFGALSLWWLGDPGDRPELLLRPVLLLSFGAGMVIYGVLEILFP
jgi:hypothetical protein